MLFNINLKFRRIKVVGAFLASFLALGTISATSINKENNLNTEPTIKRSVEFHREVGKPLSGDALDGVTVRFRPKNSHKTVAVNKDGDDSMADLHLYYLGKSSRFYLEKVDDKNYQIYYYQHFNKNAPKRDGECYVTANASGDGAAINMQKYNYKDRNPRRAYWQFIPSDDNSYYIYNEYFDRYWSLEDLDEPKKNNNKLQSKIAPYAWDIEIVSSTYYSNTLDGEEKVSIKDAKQYDSYNVNREGTVVTSLDWMSNIPGTAKLFDLNIPGTHDAATVNLPSDQFIKVCQQLYIDDLLKTGARHFDLRFKSEGNTADKIYLVHAEEKCRGRDNKDLTMQTVMAWFNKFLVDNPGETLILQITEDRGNKAANLYDYFDSLAKEENSNIWTGDHSPTLDEVRGKMYIISRLGHGDLGESRDYVTDKNYPNKKWAYDTAGHYAQSDKDHYPAYDTTINDLELWTQDDWSHDGDGKWDIVQKSLKPVTGKAYIGSSHEGAKSMGHDALCLIYTSCSKGVFNNPHDNAKVVHQNLFDSSWYTDEIFTGILANNYADEHISSLVWSSNFTYSTGVWHYQNDDSRSWYAPGGLLCNEQKESITKEIIDTEDPDIKLVKEIAHYKLSPTTHVARQYKINEKELSALYEYKAKDNKVTATLKDVTDPPVHTLTLVGDNQKYNGHNEATLEKSTDWDANIDYTPVVNYMYKTFEENPVSYKSVSECKKTGNYRAYIWFGPLVAYKDFTVYFFDDFGEITYDEATKTKLDSARSEYEALSAEQKQDIVEYYKLYQAEATYYALRFIDLVGSYSEDIPPSDINPLINNWAILKAEWNALAPEARQTLMNGFLNESIESFYNIYSDLVTTYHDYIALFLNGPFVPVIHPEPVLESLVISGTYKNVFEVGQDFNYEGLVVYAHSSDVEDVMLPSTDYNVDYSKVDMLSPGKYTVTVSYGGGVTVKATYTVEVKEPQSLNVVLLTIILICGSTFLSVIGVGLALFIKRKEQ